MMIDPDLAFAIGNNGVLLAWIALALALFVPAMRNVTLRVTGMLVPALLAVAYILLIGASFGETPGGGFGSIAQIRALFANDHALTAGWFHYLAFDLFVGSWIVRDGLSRGVPRLGLLLCLPLTLMFGPAGLLLYFGLRLAFGGRGEAKAVLA